MSPVNTLFLSHYVVLLEGFCFFHAALLSFSEFLITTLLAQTLCLGLVYPHHFDSSKREICHVQKQVLTPPAVPGLDIDFSEN